MDVLSTTKQRPREWVLFPPPPSVYLSVSLSAPVFCSSQTPQPPLPAITMWRGSSAQSPPPSLPHASDKSSVVVSLWNVASPVSRTGSVPCFHSVNDVLCNCWLPALGIRQTQLHRVLIHSQVSCHHLPALLLALCSLGGCQSLKKPFLKTPIKLLTLLLIWVYRAPPTSPTHPSPGS